MPTQPIRPLVVSLLLAALAVALGCAPTCVADGNGNVTIVDENAANDGPNADTGEPVECGGLCRPDRCPAGYYYVGPPNCSCLPKK